MEEEEILLSMNKTDDVDMIGDDLDIAADENTSDVVSNENENIPDSEESPTAGRCIFPLYSLLKKKRKNLAFSLKMSKYCHIKLQ